MDAWPGHQPHRLQTGATHPSPVTRIEKLLARVFLALIALSVSFAALEWLSLWLLGDARVGVIEAAWPAGFTRKPGPT